MEITRERPNGRKAHYNEEIRKRSDRLMNYFLSFYFLTGLLLAPYYDTWIIALGAGGIVLIAYYSVKVLLPESILYQYVLGAGLGIFMAQYIYQMHGLFEMHFFAFIGSALLITYQQWRLQIPLFLVVLVHHALFSYLQDMGHHYVYFTQLDYFDLQTFVIHILLTGAIVFICGLWAFQLRKYREIQIAHMLEMAELQKEVQLSEERRQNAEMLEGLNRELKLSNQELEQFAYVASHDMQEPLRMVSSFMGRLEEKYGHLLDEKGMQYIHFAVDGSKRMRQIILDLLEYSRVGRSTDKLTIVNLEYLLDDILGLFRNPIQEKKAVIKRDAMPAIVSFQAPLRQVFQNLIGNALKYQRPGVSPYIYIGAADQQNHWYFSVRDNGIGIEPGYFDQIFMIFQRLHTREQFEGTGVGLAVTKKIIENLGGKIWVESQPGEGSTFHFTICKNEVLSTEL
jgi:signal transduction histidine kinase